MRRYSVDTSALLTRRDDEPDADRVIVSATSRDTGIRNP